MEMRAKTHLDALVVSVLASRIDAGSAIQFKDQMRDLTVDVKGRVVLDMAQVDFVDSSGLGAIVAAMKQLAPAHRLDLANLTPNVDKVFCLTRMNTVFNVYSDINAAFSEMQQAG